MNCRPIVFQKPLQCAVNTSANNTFSRLVSLESNTPRPKLYYLKCTLGLAKPLGIKPLEPLAELGCLKLQRWSLCQLPNQKPKLFLKFYVFCLSFTLECLSTSSHTHTHTNPLTVSYLSKQITTQKLLDQYSV